MAESASDFVLRRSGPPAQLSTLKEAGLRSFALLTKYGGAATPGDAISLKLAQGAAGKIAASLAALPALALWKDWVPPRSDPQAEITGLGKDAATSSGNKNATDYHPSKALEDGSSCWSSSSNTRAASWTVNFGKSVMLTGVALEFKASQLSESIEVEVTESEAYRPDFKSLRKWSGKEVKAALALECRVPVRARQVKVSFTGYGSGNSDNVHSLVRARFWEAVPQEKFTSATAALGQLQGWLASVAAASGSALAASAAARRPGLGSAAADAPSDVFEAAVRGLAGLARSTGSLRCVLALAQALLQAPHRPLGAAAGQACAALLERLQEQARRERAQQSALEYLPVRVQGSSGGSGPSWGVLEAVWDKACASAGATVQDNGRSVKSSDSNHNYCLMALDGDSSRGFSSGKAEWTLKLVEDTDSQCSCFGVSTKPVTSPNYDTGPSMHMYRSYNGYRYAAGTTASSTASTRIYKGNTVKFELDFDEADGVLKMWIEGAAQGVVFSKLRGKELWPAVCFYGSNRQVDIVSVSGPKGKGGRAPVADTASGSAAPGPFGSSDVGDRSSPFLSDLPEHHVAVGQGGFGKGGELGYGKAGETRKVKVGGTGFEKALSMHPPAATGAAAAAGGAGGAGATASEPTLVLSGGAGAAAAGALSSAAHDSSSSSSSGSSSSAEDEARRERLLKSAQAETRTTFGHAASAVYWLGRGYESLAGSVALNDTATAELRGAVDASPVFFEVYGDGKLLWRSEPLHAAKAPALPFVVRVLGVEVLRLVTRVAAGSGGAHAVWLEPRLTSVTEWFSYGWRNDRAAFTDAITGVARGTDAPLPEPAALGLVAASDRGKAAPGAAASTAWLGTSHGLAQGLLAYTGLLAKEHLRGMRRALEPVDGVAAIDVEAPFALEPSEATVSDLAGLIAFLAEGRYRPAGAAAALGGLGGDSGAEGALDGAAVADTVAALIRILTANLRRVAVAKVSPAAVGLATKTADAPSASSGAGGKGGKDSAKGGIRIAPVVTGLIGQLYKSAAWGGAAAGRRLVDTEAGAAAATAASATSVPEAGASPVFGAPAVQDAIWEMLDLTSSLLAAAGGGSGGREERAALVRAVASGAGTVEVQLSWPCDESDGDGALVQLETVLLQLQLAAQAAGLRSRLFGRWPAKVYLLLEVPAGGEAGGVRGFLDGTLADVLASVDLKEWWSEEADSLPVKVERSAGWDRRARLPYEPGLGAVRVYPAYAASFDEVAASLAAFLPEEA